MKKIITLLFAAFTFVGAWAQAPNKMSYQAVIRNSSNALVASKNVRIQISILQVSSSGTAVYVETQTPITLKILGVIMYIRLPWVVGNEGVGRHPFILLHLNLITILNSYINRLIFNVPTLLIRN